MPAPQAHEAVDHLASFSVNFPLIIAWYSVTYPTPGLREKPWEHNIMIPKMVVRPWVRCGLTNALESPDAVLILILQEHISGLLRVQFRTYTLSKIRACIILWKAHTKTRQYVHTIPETRSVSQKSEKHTASIVRAGRSTAPSQHGREPQNASILNFNRAGMLAIWIFFKVYLIERVAAEQALVAYALMPSLHHCDGRFLFNFIVRRNSTHHFTKSSYPGVKHHPWRSE